MTTHHGSCHCGTVTYSVNATIENALSCNCSHCARKGLLLTFVPEAQFTLHTGEDNLIEYFFNKHHIRHRFCKTCGVQCFADAANNEGQKTVAINVRTLPDIDLNTLIINQFDGRSK